MKFHRKGIALAIALTSLFCSFSARADWAQSTDPLVVQPAPANGQVQAQNPPGFAWARYPSGPASYEIEITPVGGSPTKAVVDRNWYLPTKALPLGNYTWRVRPANSSDWSAPRSFSITNKSTVFEVPDNATLRARILAKARPRSLPASTTPFSTWNTAKKTELEPYLSRLTNEVKVQMTALPDLSDARWPITIASPLTAQMASQQTDVRNKINEATRQMEAAALLWRVRKEQVYLNEAIKRGDQLASLTPTGPTSYANQDQATRQIALSLIKTIDMLPGDLDGTRRNRWLDAVRIRTNEMFGYLSGDNGRLDQYPFDSHGNTLMIFMSLISSLSLGDIPDAQKWFDFCFRAYVNTPSPWAGPEGGYANGTAYAEYAAGYMVALWDSINQASGVNMYAKPWSLGFLDFAMMLTPPGAKVHAFGDGSETKPDPRVFRAFALRMVNPRANWYQSKLSGIEDGMAVLEAPYPMPIVGNQVYAPPSNEAYYPSTGWVAIHSDIGNANRSSFYFKSSPYGSFNHSHGDQNGLLLSVAGQPLLVKAGWYDWYGSPQWTDWYHQTRSQNAITFDGGKGQLVDGYREQLQRNGKITGWAVNPNYDYAEGDATPAYGGQLTMAKRQIWYFKAQDAMLVRDKLSAVVPHTYEFNIHAPVAITVESPSSVKIATGGQSVCLRDLNGNAPFATWTGPAPKAGVTESHGAFYLKNDGKSVGEFLVLMDVGCKRPSVKVAASGTGRAVTIGSQTVTIN
ncbi:DUF4962 domain-containing protein [Massilia norwichensis]|uniref:DUF4962 domain-containing protein n=1 Tax=Massilia norwichensis TaxID=1442366 RepID=A0ABT2A589_9BURK|nr:DUF4962 domain-containing protein [Massilia norwichensis]MCS0589348.1 DUF4962 domain-containing protein [Massilia norwichensis]